MSRITFFNAAALIFGIFAPSFYVAAGESPAKVVNEVDRLLKQETQPAAAAGKPAPLVNDEAFLRRISLDLIGRAPSPEEAAVFMLDGRSDKRTREIDRLLGDKQFGENWGRYWRDVIFYRRSLEQSIIASNSCEKYLAEELNKNTPWDKIATSFVTAKGDVVEHGETAIIFVQGAQPEDTVAEISRIFLGIQIQCAQCHDHPSDQWKREQFHELAAFFPRVALRPNNVGNQRGFTIEADDREPLFGFRGNANLRIRGTPEHHMPDKANPSAKGTLMQPVFFATNQKVKVGTKDADRRGTLAEWLSSKENEWFAKAFVNRIWSELVGEGFYEPVDDLGPTRPCSAQQTLDYLANQFRENGHDIKWLFRTIEATDAYQRESRSRRDSGETPYLANVSQRLRSDQLFNNLSYVLGIEERNVQRPAANNFVALRFRQTPRTQFNATFGFDPSNHRDEVAGSIPQALALMNGNLVNQTLSAQRGTLAKMLAENKDDEAMLAELYVRVLSREPTSKETEIGKKYVRQIGNRGEAFEDLLWSLINSTEFLHRR